LDWTFQQLRQGIPPDLRFIGLSDINVRNPSTIVEHGFPMVRVVRIEDNYWTVSKKSVPGSNPSATAGIEMELWPKRRALYHATEWLEWLGCEDAMIRDPSAF
jgi:hypothetical protein